jgi:type VI secretion system protein ImpA
MNELIEKLLQPVPGDQPCGPDLSSDPRFEDLQTILKGKPEVEVGNVKKPAEPPNWTDLRKKSIEFLQGDGKEFKGSKDLRVAMMLCCAMLNTNGLAGLRDGLQLVRGLLEQFWGALYPLLDPGDNNDPVQRLNILKQLTTERRSYGVGWLSITDYLYTAPLCQPKGAPPITFDQLQAAKLNQAGGALPADAPSLAGLASALHGAVDQVTASHQALQQALDAVHGIDQFLTNTLSAGNTISFEELQKMLREMLTGLQAYLPGGGGEAAAASEVGGATGEVPGAGLAGASISGVVRSRDDVVRALDSIINYYDQAEPGSPVPFLLRRAQKLATMNFVQTMEELNLATADTLRPSLGSAVAPPPAS